jgi:hypothetical protein
MREWAAKGSGMSGQLHITHRDEYGRGRVLGQSDALAGRYYAPRGAAADATDQQRAFGLGYEDGWAEKDPCSNGKCHHIAHQQA